MTFDQINQKVFELAGSFVENNRMYPNMLTMHPEAFYSFINTCPGDQKYIILDPRGKLEKIQGLRVIRSHDIEENELIVSFA